MNALAVRADGDITTLGQLIERARANPGKLSYASSGAGSSPHLSTGLPRVRTSIDLVHLPCRGSAPGMAELIGGRADFIIDNMPNVLAQVRGGKLRALAVTGRERDPTMAEVPTVAEAGVPDMVVHAWFGFIGPAFLPQPVRDRLATAITRIVTSPETAKRSGGAGTTVCTLDQAGRAALIRTELERWAQWSAPPASAWNSRIGVRPRFRRQPSVGMGTDLTAEPRPCSASQTSFPRAALGCK